MSSLITIDAGNTRLKWAVHDGITWRAQGVMPIADAREAAALAADWNDLKIDAAIVSNVAGDGIGNAVRLAFESRHINPHFIRAEAAQCGVTNRYTNPHQLGTDRWAAIIAAHHLDSAGVAKLVVMAGTALTIDALSASGEFLGGTIMPGPRLMRESLNRGTANLPLDAGAHHLFPQSTQDAIATGAIEACAGGIARMYAHLAERVGTTPICVGSGGALHEIAQKLALPVAIHDNLVMEGLLRLSQNN